MLFTCIIFKTSDILVVFRMQHVKCGLQHIAVTLLHKRIEPLLKWSDFPELQLIYSIYIFFLSLFFFMANSWTHSKFSKSKPIMCHNKSFTENKLAVLLAWVFSFGSSRWKRGKWKKWKEKKNRWETCLPRTLLSFHWPPPVTTSWVQYFCKALYVTTFSFALW